MIKASDTEELKGLVQMCQIKLGYLSFRKSKRSAEMALHIIHRMINDPEYKLKATVLRTFSGFSLEFYKMMDLGKHYWNKVNGHCRMKTTNNVPLELIKLIKQRRLKDIFPLSTIITKDKYLERLQQDMPAKEEKKEKADKKKGDEEEEDEDEDEEDDESSFESEELSSDGEQPAADQTKLTRKQTIDLKKKNKKRKLNVLNDWGKQPVAWALVDKDDRANFTLVKNQAE